MLYEVYCDKFVEVIDGKPKPRGRIRMNPGLNIVLGETIIENSIGKSTFLLVVDFCFGGKDYVNSNINNAKDFVHTHTINFAFKFGDAEPDYFGRCTATPDLVSICDKDYKPVGEPISLDDFNKYLKEHYGTADPTDSFRNMVGRYLRIYGRENYAERFPLKYGNEGKEGAIVALEKLFNVYQQIADYKEAFQNLFPRNKARQKATSVGEMDQYAARTAKEVKENNKEIERLQKQLDELTVSQDVDLSNQSSENIDKAADIKTQLTALRRKRTRLESQLSTVKANIAGGLAPTEDDFHELAEYFPDVNVERLEEVVHFHSKMQTILTAEMSDEIERLTALISEIEAKVSALEAEQRELGVPVHVSTKYMQEYAEIQRKIDYLKSKNKGFETTKKLKDSTKSAKEELIQNRQEQLDIIASKINQEMVPLNDYLYEGTRFAPEIHFRTTKAADAKPDYTFKTYADGGTATNYKSMLVFDIAILKLTSLPILAHDSLLYNNIAPVPVERIFRTYEKINKQIFVAYDKKSTQAPIPQDILDRAQILYLYPNGGELFGWSWAKKGSKAPEISNENSDDSQV